ncbi:glycogen/starch/alpha-glucan family phosphorylase [Erysipelothrix urinaevulpis]|uniref:glycogen/starch/alpha-glucan family phosphorylase n=1 Tax=Erysipelothrix urinaevulpis TaxID=2683717 RepID=UPI00135A369C|nr:glycogen/starch/alpha-glucan family phosphorylase [Erysipelothrix urinaevulpis]
MEKKILDYLTLDLDTCTTDELYNEVLSMTKEMSKIKKEVTGERTVYYMSAEFLIGKLLSNNLMNLGIYDELESILVKHGRSITELEDYEPEPSLGNGGLGRLAACFLDSIATLGIKGEGLGLLYHFGLFKQVFQNNQQTEHKDAWLDRPSWAMPTDFKTTFKIGDVDVVSRMYKIDVLGYNEYKIPLNLFDLESVDEKLVSDGIRFDQEKLESNLTLFLYPDDSNEKGLRLRFAQQFFMVKSGLAWILENHKNHLEDLDKHAVIQINDTHPAMAIVLLYQALLKHGITNDKALKIVENTFAYTNHTILAEALEKWPIHYFESVDHSLVPLLHELNEKAKSRSNDSKTLIIDEQGLVHMAALSIHFSHSTNGVAALHTDILKNTELKHFYDLYPDKFNNKTNGITFRRWLQFSNPELTKYIESLIGSEFKENAMELEKLSQFAEDNTVQKEIENIKYMNKKRLAEFLKREQSIEINVDSVFDIQIKRLHEYKRQQMNLLYAIDMVEEIRSGKIPSRPLTMFFGSKAAPAYTLAKDIIHALLVLSKIIDNDPIVSPHLKIVFVENYNVTKAEYLIPACDISEQISLASKEASGTGNMKFMLNGALTLGTLDGANVEISELVGSENIYIFGESSETVIAHYEHEDYVSKVYYEDNVRIKRACDFLVTEEMLALGNQTNLDRLYQELLNKDWFMTLLDLEDYINTKNRMLEDYEDREAWNTKVIHNIAKAGFFSSDRTIAQYNEEIWNIK